MFVIIKNNLKKFLKKVLTFEKQGSILISDKRNTNSKEMVIMTTKQWEARQKKEIMEDIKGRVLLVKALRRQLEVSNNNYENRETLLDITSKQTQIIKLANSVKN